jgi:hypothetical protein
VPHGCEGIDAMTDLWYVLMTVALFGVLGLALWGVERL